MAGLIDAARIVKIKWKRKAEAKVLSSHLSLHLVTWWLLSLLCVFSAADMLFGDHINCSVQSKEVTQEVFTAHCFMAETFTIPLAAAQPAARHQVPAERRHQNYYQWVSLSLLLQGVAAGLPVWLWHRLEAGKLTRLLAPLLQQQLVESPVARQVRTTATFLRAHPDWYRAEAFACLACEFLSLLLTLGQVFTMNLLLGGQFVVLLQPEILATLFPRVVGCSMSVFGVSASAVEVSGICTLNFNVIHEKIYAFLWVWFLVLALASALRAVWQAAILLLPALRRAALRARTGRWHPELSYARLVLLLRVTDNLDITQMEELVEQLVNGPKEEEDDGEDDD